MQQPERLCERLKNYVTSHRASVTWRKGKERWNKGRKEGKKGKRREGEKEKEKLPTCAPLDFASLEVAGNFVIALKIMGENCFVHLPTGIISISSNIKFMYIYTEREKIEYLSNTVQYNPGISQLPVLVRVYLCKPSTASSYSPACSRKQLQSCSQ